MMAKKDFKSKLMTGSPAAAFFTGQAAEPQQPADPARETKSVRVNLLLKPSTKAGIEKLAALDRSSMNALINDVLETYLQDREADLERYESFFEQWENYKNGK